MVSDGGWIGYRPSGTISLGLAISFAIASLFLLAMAATVSRMAETGRYLTTASVSLSMASFRSFVVTAGTY